MTEKVKEEEIKKECDCQHDEKCTCGEECSCKEKHKNNKKHCECEQHKHKHCECEHKYQDKAMEYLETAQRLQADFDNYRKKVQEQIAFAKYDGTCDAIKQFLPVLDSLAGARKMVQDPKLLEGFVMIENQIENAFKNLNVEKIEAVGKHFDPNLHSALAAQHNPDIDDDIVVSEYQAGYKIKDKIIRYSQVIVNKKEEE